MILFLNRLLVTSESVIHNILGLPEVADVPNLFTLFNLGKNRVSKLSLFLLSAQCSGFFASLLLRKGLKHFPASFLVHFFGSVHKFVLVNKGEVIVGHFLSFTFDEVPHLTFLLLLFKLSSQVLFLVIQNMLFLPSYLLQIFSDLRHNIQLFILFLEFVKQIVVLQSTVLVKNSPLVLLICI